MAEIYSNLPEDWEVFDLWTLHEALHGAPDTRVVVYKTTDGKYYRCVSSVGYGHEYPNYGKYQLEEIKGY